ncbi:MAG: flippase-like domain-containing protein, partial [Burkholderiaceae bacterium]|nr:flippase-like domain-containing protein [Burkholderiaceae bacterium]
AALAAVVWLADWPRVLAVLRQSRPGWIALGLVFAVASNVVSALRWRALVRWLGGALPVRQALRWYFQAMSLNVLLPGAVVGGDVWRAWVLRRAGQPVAAASWSVLLDRLSGLWMLCALGAVGAAASAGVLGAWLRVPPFWLATLALLGTALWLALPWALPWLLRGVVRRAGGDGVGASLHAPGWGGTLAAAAHRRGFGRQLAGQSLASLLVQALSAAALAASGYGLGVRLDAAAWAFAVAPVFLMAALPVSVGGWGTREAAAVAALAPFGVPAAAAVGCGLMYGMYGVVQAIGGALAFGFPGAPSATKAAP